MIIFLNAKFSLSCSPIFLTFHFTYTKYTFIQICMLGVYVNKIIFKTNRIIINRFCSARFSPVSFATHSLQVERVQQQQLQGL